MKDWRAGWTGDEETITVALAWNDEALKYDSERLCSFSWHWAFAHAFISIVSALHVSSHLMVSEPKG